MNFHHLLLVLRQACFSVTSLLQPTGQCSFHWPSHLQWIQILGSQGLAPGSGEHWPILYEVHGLSFSLFPGTSLILLCHSENAQNRNHLKHPALQTIAGWYFHWKNARDYLRSLQNISIILEMVEHKRGRTVHSIQYACAPLPYTDHCKVFCWLSIPSLTLAIWLVWFGGVGGRVRPLPRGWFCKNAFYNLKTSHFWRESGSSNQYIDSHLPFYCPVAQTHKACLQFFS